MARMGGIRVVEHFIACGGGWGPSVGMERGGEGRERVWAHAMGEGMEPERHLYDWPRSSSIR